ncbi:MAG TPA: PQQ-dependent sugar dehydrogenase [Nannocystaceae bacterium]|nr:PQQ-dependent sugar dehydrogenase [Nannocystaceae bacterium]
MAMRIRFGLVACWTIAGCYTGPNATADGGSSSSSTTSPTTTVGTTLTTDASATMTTASTSATTTASTTSVDTSGDATTTTATTDPTDTGTTASDSSSSDGGETGPITPPCPYDAVDAPSGFDLEIVASDLSSPLFALGAPNEPDRLFVLEQGGTIVMFEPGSDVRVEPPILDIGDVLSGGERGLLGLAFHPNFPDDPRIYVNYTSNDNGNTIIEEYALDPNDDYAGDPDSARVITEIYQPESNHNGGGIAFDPDGWLVIGMGDGGTSSTSRNPGILLSKFLRIGVEPDGNPDDTPACNGCPTYGPFDYTIPGDNPFVGMEGYAPEILAWGFRNPWRWSMDVGNGQIWIGDVGDGSWEEIDLLEPGRDYGWVDMEGFHCHDLGNCDDEAGPHEVNANGYSMPLIDIDHGSDCAVIGGAVYRSCQSPDSDGIYFYTDYCNSDVRALRWDGSNVDDLGVVIDPGNGFLGNGWNAWGDVYFTGGSFMGHVWRVVPVP